MQVAIWDPTTLGNGQISDSILYCVPSLRTGICNQTILCAPNFLELATVLLLIQIESRQQHQDLL